MVRQSLFTLSMFVFVAIGPGLLVACTMSSSTPSAPEIEIEVEFEDYDDVRDRLLYKIEIEAEVVAPSQSAQCQCGIGVGSNTFMAPDSFAVTAAAVGVRNDNGLEFDLEDFEGFAPDGSVTTSLEGLPGFNLGATPFGLSTDVKPFKLPPLNPGDKFVLGFLIEFAPDDFGAVNGTSIQFAAGSNEPGHPLSFFQGYQSTLELPSFQLDACDVNFDQSCDIDDLNAIFALGPIDQGVPRTDETEVFDLNGDDVIDMQDVDEWLDGAASYNGFASPYNYGDANLDGVVDGLDFIAWNDNRFTASLQWDEGNFDGNGFIDGQDFVAWNENKFTSSGVVPEPTSLTLASFLVLAVFAKVRERVMTLAS